MATAYASRSVDRSALLIQVKARPELMAHLPFEEEVIMFPTAAELRKKALRARTFAYHLPPYDEAVERLFDYAAELDARADVLERQAGCTAAQPERDAIILRV